MTGERGVRTHEPMLASRRQRILDEIVAHAGLIGADPHDFEDEVRGVPTRMDPPTVCYEGPAVRKGHVQAQQLIAAGQGQFSIKL